jgi:hypothetical protein
MGEAAAVGSQRTVCSAFRATSRATADRPCGNRMLLDNGDGADARLPGRQRPVRRAGRGYGLIDASRGGERPSGAGGKHG